MKIFYRIWFGIHVITQLFAQSLDPIPFDWSGQNGMSSYGGLLVWNRDWNSNELFFDGTFQSYPLRFGEEISRDATLSYTYAFCDISFPDSTEVHTSFDYRQGDYLYDQLNLHADFSRPERIMKWNGFKRSYGGPFSQFIQPQTGNKSTRALTPNQQSYSFYYLSKMNNRISALSIGRFITDSGLYNNSEINGLHQDEITTATFFSKSNWNQFNLKFIISQYLENRKWLSEFSFADRHYLNRGQILGILSPDDIKNSSWELGISGNTQALAFPDTTISKNRSWISVWGNLNRSRFQINGGLDAGNGSVLPRFSITMNRSSGSMRWINEVGMKNIPQHLMIWKSSQSFFESWINVNSKAIWNNGNLTVFGIFNYWHVNNLIKDGMESTISLKEMFSIETGYGWEAIHGLKISGSWRHSNLEPIISDGISDQIKCDFEFTKSLFSDNMRLSADLIIVGLLNRDTSFGFDPGLGRPFEHDWDSYILPDYWTAHLDINARVSSVVITYRIRNLFHTQKNTIKYIYPDLPEEWIWPRNNAHSLPMGQLVSFGVEWEFEE